MDPATQQTTVATEVNVIPVADWYQFKKPGVGGQKFLDEIDEDFEAEQKRKKEKFKKYKNIGYVVSAWMQPLCRVCRLFSSHSTPPHPHPFHPYHNTPPPSHRHGVSRALERAERSMAGRGGEDGGSDDKFDMPAIFGKGATKALGKKGASRAREPASEAAQVLDENKILSLARSLPHHSPLTTQHSTLNTQHSPLTHSPIHPLTTRLSPHH